MACSQRYNCRELHIFAFVVKLYNYLLFSAHRQLFDILFGSFELNICFLSLGKRKVGIKRDLRLSFDSQLFSWVWKCKGYDISSGPFCKEFLLLPCSILSLKNNPVPVSDVKQQVGLFVLNSLYFLKMYVNTIKQFGLKWLNLRFI